MNIIQAFQQAENGKIIRNGFLNMRGHFLYYIKDGIFYQYELIGDTTYYKYEIHNFSTAYILSNDWEVMKESFEDFKHK